MGARLGFESSGRGESAFFGRTKIYKFKRMRLAIHGVLLHGVASWTLARICGLCDVFTALACGRDSPCVKTWWM